MVDGLSFRARLLLSFLVVIIVALSLPTWYSRHVVSREVLAESKISAARQLNLVARLLTQEGAEFGGLHERLESIGVELGVRLTYVDASGEVVADSLSHVPQLSRADYFPLAVAMAREAGGETIVESGETETTSGRMIFTARQLDLVGYEDGVLVLALPYTALASLEERLVGNFLLGIGLTFALSVPIILFLIRQLSTSIKDMVTVAQAIASGDYTKRMYSYAGREFEPLARAINHMTENIRLQVQTITAQNAQLEAILDGIREGVMVLGSDGRIKSMNRALEDIFPGIMGSVDRKPLEAILDDTLQKACDAVLAESPTGDVKRHLLQIEPDKGKVYDVGIVRLNENDTGLGAVVVFHDISQLKRLERVRRDFVANVSHELRTPLTSIKGYAETLMESDLSNQGMAKKFLEVIQKNANAMAKIVGDLLNLSRLEADSEPMRMDSMDAARAVSAAYRECQHLAEDKSIVFENDVAGREVPVRGDFDRVVQVFRNLIENAIKYSASGGRIRVFSRREGSRVVFGVSDQGPGIPRRERQRIFERFYRLEKDRTYSGATSSGLGLAITRHIVEKHGGRIWVESPAAGENLGATFYFSLTPAGESGQERETDSRGEPAENGGHASDEAGQGV
jgi:two-component system phosphate regulon sensor histidine kinase PhoR